MSTSSPVAVPCISWPFMFTDNGPGVVEQGSYAEVLACVQTVVNCPVGACPELPTFGIPDPTFQPAPPNTSALLAAIKQWEPRATETATTQALDSTQADWVVQLNTDVSVAGTGS